MGMGEVPLTKTDNGCRWIDNNRYVKHMCSKDSPLNNEITLRSLAHWERYPELYRNIDYRRVESILILEGRNLNKNL